MKNFHLGLHDHGSYKSAIEDGAGWDESVELGYLFVSTGTLRYFSGLCGPYLTMVETRLSKYLLRVYTSPV